jgi:UDP-N-acetylglucosamine/UDP-N-acetylgalactosamine diphosphorylase
MPSSEQVDELRAKYAHQSQDHVFAFWEDLSNDEKAELFNQLSSIDPSRVTRIAETVFGSKTDTTGEVVPPPAESTASAMDASSEELSKWRETGLKAIAAGKVAVLLMAGGQGTRLGSSAPKVCYDIGLPSAKSLFQLQAERLVKLQQWASEEYGNRADATIPWYIMTSGPTRKETEDYLRSQNFFGLKEENVIIFEQGVLPCLTNKGKIIMENKHKVRTDIWN